MAYKNKNIVSVTGVSLDKTSVSIVAGETTQLTATVSPANATQKDVTWTTSDASVATVDGGKVSAKAAGTATITVTSADDEKTATCTVTVREAETQNVFNDVKQTDWYFKAVQFVYINNVMAGTGDDFRPNDSLTREQFTQVLYNHKGKPVVSIENSYTDVKNEWYRNSVLWAKENNIANGKGDGIFGVGANITREELALMLYKYAVLCGFDTAADDAAIEPYGDTANVSSWAKNAMNWAVTKGIMSGKGTGEDLSAYRLDPQGKATRAECASMMRKLLTMNE